MIPFLATIPTLADQVVLVIGTVWSGKTVFLIYIKPDRTFGYLPTEMFVLRSLHTQMPDIFEWLDE